jgi:hypothetical protein
MWVHPRPPPKCKRPPKGDRFALVEVARIELDYFTGLRPTSPGSTVPLPPFLPLPTPVWAHYGGEGKALAANATTPWQLPAKAASLPLWAFIAFSSTQIKLWARRPLTVVGPGGVALHAMLIACEVVCNVPVVRPNPGGAASLHRVDPAVRATADIGYRSPPRFRHLQHIPPTAAANPGR